ncbi:polyprenol monophosphomannose synthase [Patescibacteria group bacterium]|nr:polyprenol monophosphomannose synthase [Patescibacteria group bacterium]
MESKTSQVREQKKKIIVIPTYNERDNICELIEEIFLLVPDIFLLVIDDNSPDGTGQIVKDLQRQYPKVILIERSGKLGLGTAYKLGFKYALEHNFDYIMEMDADFSHDPAVLENFFLNVEKYDLVIGSRYIRGGRLVNWPLLRWALSYLASFYVRLITGLPIKDTTAGFKCFKKEVLQSINLNEIISEGYSFQIEMHYKAWKNGWRIKEIPITFVDRSNGISKMNNKIIWEAIWTPWKLKLAPIYNYIRKEGFRFDLEDIEF